MSRVLFFAGLMAHALIGSVLRRFVGAARDVADLQAQIEIRIEERVAVALEAHKQRVAAAWHEGYAHGQRAGAQEAFEAVNAHIRERTGIYEAEVTPADLAAARKEWVH